MTHQNPWLPPTPEQAGIPNESAEPHAPITQPVPIITSELAPPSESWAPPVVEAAGSDVAAEPSAQGSLKERLAALRQDKEVKVAMTAAELLEKGEARTVAGARLAENMWQDAQEAADALKEAGVEPFIYFNGEYIGSEKRKGWANGSYDHKYQQEGAWPIRSVKLTRTEAVEPPKEKPERTTTLLRQAAADRMTSDSRLSKIVAPNTKPGPAEKKVVPTEKTVDDGKDVLVLHTSGQLAILHYAPGSNQITNDRSYGLTLEDLAPNAEGKINPALIPVMELSDDAEATADALRTEWLDQLTSRVMYYLSEHEKQQ